LHLTHQTLLQMTGFLWRTSSHDIWCLWLCYHETNDLNVTNANDIFLRS